MTIMLGTITGALLGPIFAMPQVILLRRYAVGKPPQIRQHAFDTMDQVKLTSALGLPLILAVVGYRLAVQWTE